MGEQAWVDGDHRILFQHFLPLFRYTKQVFFTPYTSAFIYHDTEWRCPLHFFIKTPYWWQTNRRLKEQTFEYIPAFKNRRTSLNLLSTTPNISVLMLYQEKSLFKVLRILPLFLVEIWMWKLWKVSNQWVVVSSSLEQSCTFLYCNYIEIVQIQRVIRSACFWYFRK